MNERLLTVHVPTQRLKRSLELALFSAVLTAILCTGLALAYFSTLPTPSSMASQETVESYLKWKWSLYAPVGLVAFVVVPMTVGLARFVSLYPPCPINFVLSLTVISFVAGITHWAASPLKGPADTRMVLIAIAASALVVLGLGFYKSRNRSANPP